MSSFSTVERPYGVQTKDWAGYLVGVSGLFGGSNPSDEPDSAAVGSSGRGQPAGEEDKTSDDGGPTVSRTNDPHGQKRKADATELDMSDRLHLSDRSRAFKNSRDSDGIPDESEPDSDETEEEFEARRRLNQIDGSLLGAEVASTNAARLAREYLTATYATEASPWAAFIDRQHLQQLTTLFNSPDALNLWAISRTDRFPRLSIEDLKDTPALLAKEYDGWRRSQILAESEDESDATLPRGVAAYEAATAASLSDILAESTNTPSNPRSHREIDKTTTTLDASLGGHTSTAQMSRDTDQADRSRSQGFSYFLPFVRVRASVDAIRKHFSRRSEVPDDVVRLLDSVTSGVGKILSDEDLNSACSRWIKRDMASGAGWPGDTP